MDCGGIGNHACRSKECLEVARIFCDLHYKGGGHSKHADKEFKPRLPNVSSTNTIAINTID